MVSKYLERFQRLANLKQEEFVLVGERIIFEKVAEEEMKTKSGLIVGVPEGYRNETQSNRPMFGIILAVGQGYTNDKGEAEPVPYKPGEVISISKLGPLFFSEFPGVGAIKSDIGMTRISEIHMSWPSIEAFTKFRETLS